jgi:hypothetical protein
MKFNKLVEEVLNEEIDKSLVKSIKKDLKKVFSKHKDWDFSEVDVRAEWYDHTRKWKKGVIFFEYYYTDADDEEHPDFDPKRADTRPDEHEITRTLEKKYPDLNIRLDRSETGNFVGVHKTKVYIHFVLPK